MTDTIKHMWDQVEQARAAGTFTSENDIVERLQDRSDHYLAGWARTAMDEAAAEITKLRAERDAAARDMRERCAALALGDAASFDFQKAWADHNDREAGSQQARLHIHKAIEALPIGEKKQCNFPECECGDGIHVCPEAASAIIATEREVQS